MPIMTRQHDISREALPQEMRFLLRDYPREAWPENPHFTRSIRNWMGAHQSFRQLGEIARGETELYLTKGRDPQEFAARFAEFGNLLVRNLHGHHTWEDRKFFPELEGADPRFAEGLEMLEGDHAEMDELLDQFTRQGNRVVQLVTLDEGQARNEAGLLHDLAARLEGFLARHLSDEEDLVVPLLLHHKLRG